MKTIISFSITIAMAMLCIALWVVLSGSNINGGNSIYSKAEIDLIMAAHESGFKANVRCKDGYELYKADSLRIINILMK